MVELGGPKDKAGAKQQPVFTGASQAAVDILEHYLPEYTTNFRCAASENSFYSPSKNDDWTEGFQTGTYWLAWQLHGNERFSEAALRQVDLLMERLLLRRVVDHHDMGFLFSPSCVLAHRLTESKVAHNAALLAADNLLGRFQEIGQFFQAWGQMGQPEEYRLIIDCLMNLPLLFWATEQTGNPIYRSKAKAHIQTALKTLIRRDDSTYHTYYFDVKNGRQLHGATAQGYKADSAWARGQAWGIYGLALAYKYTGDEACLAAFRRVAQFYLRNIPADHIPYWDLCFKKADSEPRDSSAAAIAACGMLEMEPFLDDSEAKVYHTVATETAVSLAKSYAVKDAAASNGLLLHGVYAKSSPYNSVQDYGVDECTAWGDYFYLELLARLLKEETCLPW